MQSTAATVVTAALTAVVVGGAAGYWISQREPAGGAATSSQRQEEGAAEPSVAALAAALDEHHSFIYVDHEDNRCTSFTFPPKGTVKKNGMVMWHIIATQDAKKGCLRNRTVMVKPKMGETPFLDPEQPWHNRVIMATVPPMAEARKHRYDIYLADGKGQEMYMMEDPELEVVEILVP